MRFPRESFEYTRQADPALYRALNTLAQGMDALQAAQGVSLASGTPASGAAPAPPPAGWIVTAGNGHFNIQISNPAYSGLAPALQHQVASAVNQNFDTNAATAVFTLGYGQTTLDVVDPGVTKYWRLRSRTLGSGWNAWQSYSTASGVTALASGALKTS
ncbi:MAG: hypothetical protein ACYC6M_03640 [Terriglobales bacterium]